MASNLQDLRGRAAGGNTGVRFLRGMKPGALIGEFRINVDTGIHRTVCLAV